MLRLLRRLLRLLFSSHHQPHLSLQFVRADFGSYFFKGRIMALSLRADQTVVLTAAIADKFGNPTTSADSIGWAVANGNVSLTPSADGMSCTVTPTGPLGDVEVSATAGSLTAALTITVVAGLADSLSITAGEPTPV